MADGTHRSSATSRILAVAKRGLLSLLLGLTIVIAGCAAMNRHAEPTPSSTPGYAVPATGDFPFDAARYGTPLPGASLTPAATRPPGPTPTAGPPPDVRARIIDAQTGQTDVDPLGYRVFRSTAPLQVVLPPNSGSHPCVAEIREPATGTSVPVTLGDSCPIPSPYSATLSSDGMRLAYFRHIGGQTDVAWLELRTGLVTQVQDGTNVLFPGPQSINWSATGRYISYEMTDKTSQKLAHQHSSAPLHVLTRRLRADSEALTHRLYGAASV